MRTKRQPTIKTLLLIKAVVAGQCAAMARPFSENDAYWQPVERVGAWCTFLSGVFFWSVFPLLIALIVRSAKQAGAVGMGIGFLSILASRYSAAFGGNVGHIMFRTLRGP